MLAGAVDAREGLLMEQAHQSVAVGHLLHHFHGQLVLVAGGVGIGEHRRHLMLSRGYLVVLGFAEHAQLPQLLIQILHIGGDPGPDGAIVVVVQLLSLGGLCAEQGPAAHSQVLPLLIEGLVNQKILLLRPYLGSDPLRLCVAEEPEDADRLAADLVHGPQKRRLLVQGLAGVGAEDGGDAEATLLDEGKRGGIPGGVAPGLKGGPQTAGGEGGGIRLTPDQLFSGEFHEDLAAAGRGNEAVVLLRRDAGHGLEPVGVVGGALFHGPLLHGLGDLIGGGDIQRRSVCNALLPRLIGRRGQALLHGVLIEDHAAEQIGEFRGGTHAFHPPVFIKCIVSHQIWKTQQEMRIFRLICRSRRHRRGPGHRGRPRRIPQDRLGIRKSRSIQFRPEWCCPKISRSSRLTLVKGGRRPPFLRSVSKSKYVRPKRGSSSSLVQIF